MKAKSKKVRLARGRMQGKPFLCRGGPWNNEVVLIPSGGTIVMRIGVYHGKYNSIGTWVDYDCLP